MSSAFPAPTKEPTIGVAISDTYSKMNTGSPRLQKRREEKQCGDDTKHYRFSWRL